MPEIFGFPASFYVFCPGVCLLKERPELPFVISSQKVKTIPGIL